MRPIRKPNTKVEARIEVKPDSLFQLIRSTSYMKSQMKSLRRTNEGERDVSMDGVWMGALSLWRQKEKYQ